MHYAREKHIHKFENVEKFKKIGKNLKDIGTSK